MSLIKDLFETPHNLSTGSKYTAVNGVLYLGTGALLVAWPGVTQTPFRDAAFVGHEGALIRVIGLTVTVIGWLYLVRWSFRRKANRCRFCDRPIGLCSCSTPAAGHSWRVPSFAGSVCDSRPLARHWCMGARWSQYVMPQIAGTRACPTPTFERCLGWLYAA